MTKHDRSFLAGDGLQQAINLLHHHSSTTQDLPSALPTTGYGETATLDLLAPHVLGRAARLDNSATLAHMDPPTPWISWVTTLWNARLNQNLLHPATAPFAREAEEIVTGWLTPYFGMNGGHLCSGSTVANLTALWVARDIAGVKKVIASESAHLSIAKAACLLGLPYEQAPTNRLGQMDIDKLPDLQGSCFVLTAGTTATGAIDPLALTEQAQWTHVDAAWAGPLRLSPIHAGRLSGINQADSVSVSAHKWLFQPKDSALIMFRDTERANEAISFGGGYLAAPNIGVQGSRGAAAITLLATLLAWGETGVASRIEHCMMTAERLAKTLAADDNVELWTQPVSGVNVFRPTKMTTQVLQQKLPEGMFSTCVLNDEQWLRSVAANPVADIDGIIAMIKTALASAM